MAFETHTHDLTEIQELAGQLTLEEQLRLIEFIASHLAGRTPPADSEAGHLWRAQATQVMLALLDVSASMWDSDQDYDSAEDIRNLREKYYARL